LDTDVLVVGAGPTGLMLANQLRRRGIRTMIIDRHSGPAQQTRAMAVQARTLEIYSKLGIAQRALELGTRATGANLWANGRPTAHIPIGDIGANLSRFPFVLMLGQEDNERIMGERLRDWSLSPQWSTELTSIDQRPDHVQAALRMSDGSSRTLSAAYVAGCDGSRSTVRELAEIPFPGAPYEHVFFVADTVATGSMKKDEVNVYMWRDGFHLFFPMRGQDRWRVIGILPSTLRERSDLTFDDVVPDLRGEAGSELSFESCSWFSTYRIHHRRAAKFRDRRCFLLGDAAHVHSPIGAQGMNTGLQDAYNLGWKLALVIEGRADDALLDTYESERMRVAQRLLHTTDRAFRFVVSETSIAAVFRTKVMARIAAFAMTKERIRRLAFRTVSQLGIRYRHSPLSQTLPGLPENAPVGGDRFPWTKLRLCQGGPERDLFEMLDDTRFNLLVFAESVPSEVPADLGQLMGVHLVQVGSWNRGALERAQIPSPSCYLLRPDGHVALAGTRLEGADIADYLARHRLTLAARRDHADRFGADPA